MFINENVRDKLLSTSSRLGISVSTLLEIIHENIHDMVFNPCEIGEYVDFKDVDDTYDVFVLAEIFNRIPNIHYNISVMPAKEHALRLMGIYKK